MSGIALAALGWARANPLAVLLAIAVAVVGVQTLRLAWSQEKLAEIKTEFANFKGKQAELSVKQAREDMRVSAELLERQSERLAVLSGQATGELRRINDQPTTRECGPVMRDASRGVQSLIRGGGAGPRDAPAGPEPTPAVRRSGPGRQP